MLAILPVYQIVTEFWGFLCITEWLEQQPFNREEQPAELQVI